MDENKTFSCFHDHDATTTFLVTTPAKINYIMLTLTAISISVTSSVLILLFLLVLYRYKQLRHRANILLMMLSISDLTVSLIVLPLYSLQLVFLVNETLPCEISRFLKLMAYLSTIMSVTAIVLITMNFYLGVVKPYFYHTMRTNTMLRILVIAWSVLITAAIISMYVAYELWSTFIIIVHLSGILLFIVMLYLHYKVSREMTSLSDQPITRNVAMPPVQQKTLRLSSTVLVIFLLTYAPMIVITVYQKVNGASNDFIKTYVDRWCEMTSLSNPLWNSLIYCYRLKAVRKRLNHVLCKEKYESGMVLDLPLN